MTNAASIGTAGRGMEALVLAAFFVLPLSTVQAQSINFAPAASYSTGSAARSVAVGDFNNDGNTDLAVVNQTANTVSVLLGNADGSFQSASHYATGAAPHWVIAGHLNADANRDLAVVNKDSNTVSVLRGNGDGTFQAKVDYATGLSPKSLAAADFNGDGRTDIIVANHSSGGGASLLLGNAADGFDARIDVAGGSPVSVAVADFNGDGKSDLALAHFGGGANVASVLLGNGNGTFQAPQDYGTGSFPSALAVGDFNGDGKPDLAVTNIPANNVSIFLGNGDGTLQARVDYPAALDPRSIAVADFNRDRKQDLAIASGDFAAGGFSILRGNGDGSFQPPVSFPVAGGVYAVAAGQFDANGKIDLAAAATGAGAAAVFLNASAPPGNDFDGDGRSDILWRNSSTGENYLYPMEGTSIGPEEGYLRPVADLAWRVAGTGDFDGDGRADVLWRNASTGENYMYFMNGTSIVGEGYIRAVADQNWQVAGIGDFDGDGKDDVLWRNVVTGENYVYPMDGLAIKASEGYIRSVADLDWRVVGAGDFDGDGKDDILWRNGASGENYVYPMDGLAIKATEGYVRTVADLAWHVAGVADFDGDGKADIVWRNASSGENYLYPMDGTAILASEGYLRTVSDLAWVVVQAGDFDGDGKSDILWRNSATGDNYLYPMDGSAIKPTEGYLRAVADQSWRVASRAAAAASGSGLVINEVDYDQPSTDTTEFIEIYNPTSAPVSLSGLVVAFINGASSPGVEYSRAYLGSAGVLLPGAYLVVASPNVTVPAGTAVIELPGPIQNGAPDALVLFDTWSNKVIDAVSYEGTVPSAVVAAAGSFSLEPGTDLADTGIGSGSLIRYPDGTDTNDGNLDWQLTTTLTPGAANAP